MPFLLSFFTSKAGLVGMAIALVVAVIGVQTLRLNHAKGDLVKARAETSRVQASLETCQANTASLQASITAQNAAVDAMKADGDRRAKMLADGLLEARKGRAGAEARAAGLLAHPAVGVDACARAVAAREAVLRSLQ